jgi:glycosyltransferase involved in cell wall biosynthesis
MIHNKIILNKLTDRVILTGLIPFNEMPAYLKNADALLLSRPDNIQARFGMPTKLGEYLISGKPVILTSVGDITIYLKDGESAFITTPGDYNAFAEKIDYVLGNYENAIEVGLNGKKVCEEHFNYKIQSSVLLRELYRLLA